MADSESSSSSENTESIKEERLEKKKATIKCHKGHKVKYTSPKVLNSNGYDNAYDCGLCGLTFSYQGSYHCNKCKYDLCENCYDNRAAGKCPQSHPLQSFTTQQNHSYECSGCNSTIGEAIACYGCRICDYDLCPNCFSYSHSKKKKDDGGFAHFGALGGLLQMINNHMQFMNEQESNVDDFISKSGSADLLRTAKTAALDTERELMQQIMNLSEINTFLNNIILVENLFNSLYTKDIKTKQENARNTYASNLHIYESKSKPQCDIGSFVELMFAGTNLHISSFKKWLQKVMDECKAKKVKVIESSGARGKNIERAFYKSFYVYAVNHGNEGYKEMTDVLRCSLVFDNFDHLYHCFSIIEELSPGILRVKDRFHPIKVPFGYRDILINLYCPGSKVVAEIQLHHKLFYNEKKVSHDIYKKARLFEENEENMAYKYADQHIRNVIGNKKYKTKKESKNRTKSKAKLKGDTKEDDPQDDEEEEEDDEDEDEEEEEEEEEEDIFAVYECEMTAERLFERWKLTKYTESFISEEGYDEPNLWKDITMDELKNEYGFKSGHAKKFISYVQELEKQRPKFAEIKKKRLKIKKQKAKEAKLAEERKKIAEERKKIAEEQNKEEVLEEVEAPQKAKNDPKKQTTPPIANTKQPLAQPIPLKKQPIQKQSSTQSTHSTHSNDAIRTSPPPSQQQYVQPVQPPSYNTQPQQYVQQQQPQYIQHQQPKDVLPQGWTALMTNDGKVYYANNITKQTQWNKPTNPAQYQQQQPQYVAPTQPQQQQYVQQQYVAPNQSNQAQYVAPNMNPQQAQYGQQIQPQYAQQQQQYIAQPQQRMQQQSSQYNMPQPQSAPLHQPSPRQPYPQQQQYVQTSSLQPSTSIQQKSSPYLPQTNSSASNPSPQLLPNTAPIQQQQQQNPQMIQQQQPHAVPIQQQQQQKQQMIQQQQQQPSSQSPHHLPASTIQQQQQTSAQRLPHPAPVQQSHSQGYIQQQQYVQQQPIRQQPNQPNTQFQYDPQMIQQQQQQQQMIQQQQHQQRAQVQPQHNQQMIQQQQQQQQQQQMVQQQQQRPIGQVQPQYMVKTGSGQLNMNGVESTHSIGHSVEISGLDDIGNDTDTFHEKLADEIAQDDDNNFSNAYDSLYGNQQQQQ